MYQEVDTEAQKIEDGKNNYEIFNNFINLGYKHKGFNKLYEGNQPRYTFRTIFNKFNSFDEVEKTFSKSFSRPIKRSYNYDLEVYESNEVKTFHELIKLISSKDGFNEYSYDYYNNVFEELNKKGYIKIFNVKINPSKLIDKFTKELEKEKNDDRKVKIQKDIDYFKEIEKEHKDEYTCASLICTYSKTGAWSLYIGNDEVATYTGTVNRLYYEFIKDAYDNKYEYSDLFGTVGDPNTKFKNLAGIFEYKRKIGGDLIEFIGEFDLINKPFWYKVLPTLLKIYRKLKK
jgi:lipid II:glycine glycyltransferase (peptidoglycan interpeptide bridge formation enzyme)